MMKALSCPSSFSTQPPSMLTTRQAASTMGTAEMVEVPYRHTGVWPVTTHLRKWGREA